MSITRPIVALAISSLLASPAIAQDADLDSILDELETSYTAALDRTWTSTASLDPELSAATAEDQRSLVEELALEQAADAFALEADAPPTFSMEEVDFAGSLVSEILETATPQLSQGLIDAGFFPVLTPGGLQAYWLADYPELTTQIIDQLANDSMIMVFDLASWDIEAGSEPLIMATWDAELVYYGTAEPLLWYATLTEIDATGEVASSDSDTSSASETTSGSDPYTGTDCGPEQDSGGTTSSDAGTAGSTSYDRYDPYDRQDAQDAARSRR